MPYTLKNKRNHGGENTATTNGSALNSETNNNDGDNESDRDQPAAKKPNKNSENAPGEFYCVKCSKKFATLPNLQRHQRNVHKGVRFKCPYAKCDNKRFRNRESLKKHCRTQHDEEEALCCHCAKSFTTQMDLLKSKHVKCCCRITADCSSLAKNHSPSSVVSDNERRDPGSSSGGGDITAESTKASTAAAAASEQNDASVGRIDYFNHTAIPEDDIEPPWDLIEAEVPAEPHGVRELVAENWRIIRTQSDVSDVLDHEYNYRWSGVNGNFSVMINDIFAREPHTFKINGAFGMILLNSREEPPELEYFWANQSNFQLLDSPALITSRESANALIEELENCEVQEKAKRANSKVQLVLTTNVTFYVTPITDFVIGCADEPLPEVVTRQSRKNILTMQWSNQHNKIRDNLCAFRCISQCLTGQYGDDTAQYYFNKYCEKKKIAPIVRLFEGLPFSDIVLIEKMFEINIQLYHLNVGDGSAECWRRSGGLYAKTLNMDVCIFNSQKVHYSYIRNLNFYAKRYICPTCRRCFKRARYLNVHLKNKHCKHAKTEHQFPGGVYTNKLTLFEQLELAEIVISDDLKYCPYICVFDFESLLRPPPATITINDDDDELGDSGQHTDNAPFDPLKSTGKLKYCNVHQPVSCAIKSTIPRFEETKYLQNKNPDKLVADFLTYLEEISDEQYTLLTTKFATVFAQLQNKISKATEYIGKLKQDNKCYKREKGYVNNMLRLQTSLDSYCRQVTVCGFNSKKYDLLLIKRQLFPRLVQQVRKQLKTGNDTEYDVDYDHADMIADNSSSLSNDIKEELISDDDDDDMSTYEQDSESEASDGVYSSATRQIDQIFAENTPSYEEMDDRELENNSDVLDSADSSLKTKTKSLTWPKAIMHNNACICLTTPKLRFLDVKNYLAAVSSLDSFLKTYSTKVQKMKFPYNFLDDYEKLSYPCLPSREQFYDHLHDKHISEEDYQKCLKLWVDYKMKTFADYLQLYNCTDVEPFLEATVRMSEDYWEKFDIDMFREVVSLPGLTLRYLFKTNETPFGLFSKKDRDIFFELKASMRGGLSSVMKRKAVKGETFIRNNPEKLVFSILGLDANALYLWAQAMSMACGLYDYWTLTADGKKFVKKINSRRVAVEWLEYQAWQNKCHIQHAGNAKEKQIGMRRLRVDGYSKCDNTVYEFYGCYFHCHNCAAGKRNKKKNVESEKKKRLEKETYIADEGYNLVTIFECDWKDSVERNSYIQQRKLEDKKFFRKFYLHYKINEATMRANILSGDMFGFAKVCISTPEELKELYADFPPIIKHAEIGREDIGDFMRKYAEDNNLLKQKRRNLISSYSGKEIVLMTPMIKFLVEHGLTLEKVHWVLQYDELRPFVQFRDEVTEHRLKGDGYKVHRLENGDYMAEKSKDARDEASALAADTYKLLGNSSYGKTITNKERHVNTFYCDYRKAVECTMNPYFKRLKSIAPNCYEVQMKKEKIIMDLPIVIGLAVYSWAKIRMLSFAYDVLLRYFDKADYEWLETDTDSVYLAISKPNLEDLVKPDMKAEFEKIKHDWFVNPYEPYTTRKPGLFKVEFEGTSMCCLCAKTYIAVNSLTGDTKLSSKGLSKKTNNKSFEDYVRVLNTRHSGSGVNKSFRMGADNKMWTYIQERLGLPYLYIKRKVLEPGIDTVPLDI